MRILHTADLHLGLAGRTEDLRRCWMSACEVAAEHQVDLVIVAGDVFHSRDPDAQALNAFHSGLRVLGENAIPSLLIAGNHDGAAHPGRRSVLEVFDGTDVDVVTSPRVVTVGGVRVACLPWVSRQQLLATHPGMSRAGAVQSMADGLERVLDSLRTDDDGNGLPDVLTAHWSVQGAVLGNERDIAIVGQDEVVLPFAAIAGPWSYAALGHIHGYQTGHVDSTVWGYSGSIDRMNFSEEHEQKYALEIDVGNKHITPHELPSRRFRTLEWADGAVQLGEHEDLEGAIVRVRPRLTEDEARVFDRARIERDLHEAGAAIVKVQPEIERAVRARSTRVTTSLSVAEAMDEWMDLRGLDGRMKHDLRKLVRELEEDAGAVVDGAHVDVANVEDAGSSPAPRSEEVPV